MRLAMRLPPKKGDTGSATNGDPREGETAEIIDLASRAGFSPVAERKGATSGLGPALGVAIVFGLGALTLWSMNAAQIEQPEPVGNPALQPNQPAVPQPAPSQAPVPVPGPAPAQYNPAPAPIIAQDPATSPGLAINPYASPTMVYDASGSAVGVRPAPGVVAAPASQSGPGASPVGSAGAFASAIGGVGGAAVQAEAMRNPSTTLTQGTLIPAILETAINTDVPGYVRAVVSQDVRSFDGKKVLVPRSSRLIGQYQSGVENGQKRAYVIWTRLIRPDGASVNIASPAVAFDGTTGLAGDVDNKFFKRFGSAMLLSAIGGLSAIGTGGASVILGGAGQSAAGIAAQQDSSVGPTIRVKMGEPIRVFTARDVDFSSVKN